jgi:kynurenine formamidase
MEPITRRRILAAAACAAVSGPAAADEQKYPRNLTKEDVDRWMTELSNWGKWGKDDQAGTLNFITPAKRKAAAALVREGVSVSMSIDADLPKEGSTGGPLPGMISSGSPSPANRTTWTLTSRPPGPEPRDLAAYVVDTIAVSYHGNNSTHIDAPSHLYYKGQIYNGYPQTNYTDRGAGKDDVMSMKNGIFTRGVLFDMPKLRGASYLGDDEAIYPEDLEAWEKKAGFRVEPGDAVLVRTGRWVRGREKGPLNLSQSAPGLYASCVKWLRERGASILGSDVVQDVRPSRVEGVNQPIHQMALRALGMPLIDNADLDALSEEAARRRRWTYLLTVNPLRVPGATGGPVNPIAMF